MTLRILALASARPYGRAVLLLSCVAIGTLDLVHAAEKAQTHTVVIEGVQFAPAAVDAKVGDTVVWVNKDPFPHTVTSPGQFDSGNIQAGQSWRFKVKSKGTFAYICTLHPNMKATLVVR
jgi:plastocyanin